MNKIRTENRKITETITKNIPITVFEFEQCPVGNDAKKIQLAQLSRLFYSYIRSDVAEEFLKVIGVKNQIESWNIIKTLANGFPKGE